MNTNLFPIFGFKNNLIYRKDNNYFKFGYFSNIDGIGLELGYRTGGIDFTFPLLFLLSDLDVEKEMNVPLSDSLISFVKNFFLFTALNLMTRTIIKKIKNYRKIRNKENDAKKIEKAVFPNDLHFKIALTGCPNDCIKARTHDFDRRRFHFIKIF